jgi:hypothetical protein
LFAPTAIALGLEIVRKGVGLVDEYNFVTFPKIPRLFRDITVTEKLDGTSGVIMIAPSILGCDTENVPLLDVTVEDVNYYVWAGSRNRWVYNRKGEDNSGFAAWVVERAPLLVEILGEGRHFGEFWGSGIQRRYGLTGDDKRFSLFNPKWTTVLREREINDKPIPKGLGTVPVLYEGIFLTREVEDCLFRLRTFGSVAAPGFLDPEGVVVYHTAAKQYFKTTIKSDEKGKGQENG